MRNLLVCLLVAVGCGGGGGNGDGNNPDTNPGIDAAIDAPPAAVMVTISGTVVERTSGGSSPEADVTIAAYRSSDENTALATTTSDAQGNFSLTISTNGEGIVGFLKASKTGFTTVYLYPHRPVTEDLAMVPLNMLSESTFNLLAGFGNQQAGNGVVALIVLSGPEFNSTPVEGATISTTPASNPYRYNSNTGLPTSTTATAADGIAFAFNAPAGAITVTAAKQGLSFQPTMVKSFADSITQTIVSP